MFDSVRSPAVTSSDVADALDCTTEAARQKLARLYDRGLVDKRKTGRTIVYWRTDAGAHTEPANAQSPMPENTRETPVAPIDTRGGGSE